MASKICAMISIFFFLLLLLPSGHGFYLPGSYPHKYVVGDLLSVKVNSLTSIETELPYGYYSLPFCRPQEGIKDVAENLGELLMGDRIENSPYRFKMRANESDVFLCRFDSLSADDFNLFKKRIDEMYQVNHILDNRPAIHSTKRDDFLLYWTGYPVSIKIADGYYLFNHLKFSILVHKYEETNVASIMGTGDAAEMIPSNSGKSGGPPGYMVLGFEVVPCNFQHDPLVLLRSRRLLSSELGPHLIHGTHCPRCLVAPPLRPLLLSLREPPQRAPAPSPHPPPPHPRPRPCPLPRPLLPCPQILDL